MIGCLMEPFRLLIVFYQFYTKHASVEGCLLPLADDLLLDRKSTDCRLLNVLKVECPKCVTVDFEVDVRNSLTATNQKRSNLVFFLLYESKPLVRCSVVRQHSQSQQ